MINAGITKISIGSFTNKLSLFKPIQRKNERGAIENDYQYTRGIFAKVVEIAGAEQDVDSNFIALNTIEVTTYVMPDLSTSWRIGYNGNLYDVISQNRVENQPLMVIRATQIME
jgi:head-tail adaptor